MYVPTIQQFPYLAPVGTFPPATIGWLTNYVTSPTGFAEMVVPWQPGTPPGVLVPITWAVTDIFFRVENPASSGNSSVQISRSTGIGPFSLANYVNNPILIPAGLNEAPGRPWTAATINLPLVNSGDKLQSVIGLGTGASVVTLYVTLVQQPIL